MKKIKLSHKIYTLIIVTYIAIMGACSKDDTVASTENQTPETIYIAGNEENANNIAVAKFWKNGVATKLGNGAKASTALGISGLGNDIYTVGYQNNNNDVKTATYWKNDVPITLTTTGRKSEATGIYISGNDIYICGYEEKTIPANGNTPTYDYNEAKYWKNGVAVVLNPSASPFSAVAKCIWVANNKVYIGGYSDVFGVSSVGTYWTTDINGGNLVENNITNNDTGTVNGITILGTDIYAAGTQSASAQSPTYWKNGQSLNLTDNNKRTIVNGIATSGSDVYVIGVATPPGTPGFPAKYWKNGISTLLTDGANTIPTCITSFKSDIYIVATDNSIGAIKFWKNGKTSLLSTPNRAVAYAIFVTP
jgi:hypothetical protein